VPILWLSVIAPMPASSSGSSTHGTFTRTWRTFRETMNVINAEFEATAEQYKLLARKTINQADLEKYVKLVFNVKDGEETSTRMKNILEEVTGLFEAGKGKTFPLFVEPTGRATTQSQSICPTNVATTPTTA